MKHAGGRREIHTSNANRFGWARIARSSLPSEFIAAREEPSTRRRSVGTPT